MDPTDPSIVYVSRGIDGLFKSINGGNDWTDLHAVGGALVIDPKTPSTLYAASGSGLIKSTNAGVSWDPIDEGLVGEGAQGPVAIDPVTPSTLYVSMFPTPPPGGSPSVPAPGNGGVFKSIDGGLHWELVDSRPYVSSLVVDPVTPSTVYGVDSEHIRKSVNSGATWSALPASPASALSLTVDPQNASTLIVSTYYNGLFKSPDGGVTFEPVPVSLSAGTYFVGTLTSRLSTPTVYGLLASGTVVRSVNGGSRWFPASRGLSTRNAKRVAVSTGTPLEVYAGTPNRGVFRGVDGGKWWRRVGEGQLEPDVVALSVDPSDARTAYVAGFYYNVSRTRNGGDTWTLINDGLDTLPRLRSFAVDPVTPSTVYGATELGVYRSVDRGSHWIEPDHPTDPEKNPFSLESLAIDSADPANVYAGSGWTTSSGLRSGGVFRSADAAQTWSFGNTGLSDLDNVHALAIDPATPSTLYAGTDLGVSRSTDSGSSWSAASDGIPGPSSQIFGVFSLALDPVRPDTIYATAFNPYVGEAAGVYRSTDGGQHWNAFNAGLPSLRVHDLAIDSTGSTLWAAAGDAGACRYDIVPDPAVESIAPDSGPAAGGTAVTIRGGGFLAGATVRIGGASATNVMVLDGHTITALTPPLSAGQPRQPDRDQSGCEYGRPRERLDDSVCGPAIRVSVRGGP